VTDLGTFSDDVVSAAVVVFVLALVAFAAEWAFGSSGGVSRATDRDRDASAPAGAPGPDAEMPHGPAGPVGAAHISGGADSGRFVPGDHVSGGRVSARIEGAPGSTALLARPGVSTLTADGPGGGAWGAPGGSGPGRRAATAGSIGSMLQLLAVLLLGVGVVTRGIAADRVPWGNLYEFAITGSFAVTAVHVVLRRRLGLQFLDVWLAGFAATCAGSAILLFHEAVGPLRPQLRSYWLVIHVSAAVIATGVFTVGAVLAALYLFRDRREAAGRVAVGYVTRLPSATALDRMSYRVHAFAFPIYTLALIFGAVWAKAAYGRYWEWDPKETWMLISWVLYAAYLHARATAGWKGRVASVIALVAFGTILFNLLGVNFLIAGKHSYAN